MLALSGAQHTPRSGILLLHVRDEQLVSVQARKTTLHYWEPNRNILELVLNSC